MGGRERSFSGNLVDFYATKPPRKDKYTYLRPWETLMPDRLLQRFLY